ncbi:MerR family transcriptional regulator [Marinobacter zhanjiangensis]|uniref:MerR family transcriptional regulator n=1 Tax=Marinobacter zhanjiangensis TaxID=578215 RepID=A0ABQ3AN70_9GAMM|nr:MerR family transcriptional regulator [Marinobacter zhanjiangensis]GGY61308.1 MerR family transcriptional regulator [Marinobacter zhanjiangensis]
MLIGKLASSSGFSRDTIRYYEKLGLLAPGKDLKRQNNYKDYPPQALERLNHIRQLKELGFTLTEMKELFEVLATVSRPCGNLPEQLAQKLELLQRKISLLKEYQERLVSVRQACDSGCGISGGLPTCFATRKA